MKIRKATAADLDAVAAIYDAILDEEERGGKSWTNWARGVYPVREDAEGALNADTLWVGEEDGRLCGAVILNHVQLPEYAHIAWTIPAEGEEVLVIHTLVVDPAQAGRGLGRQFVAFAEQHARDLGCTVMRLDTYEGNAPAAGLHRKLGYRQAGVTQFNFHGIVENLILFEKAMDRG